jgi:hypothetical protein
LETENLIDGFLRFVLEDQAVGQKAGGDDVEGRSVLALAPFGMLALVPFRTMESGSVGSG